MIKPYMTTASGIVLYKEEDYLNMKKERDLYLEIINYSGLAHHSQPEPFMVTEGCVIFKRTKR
jgi:hypothetical protein